MHFFRNVDIERVKSGIKNFDRLISSGFEKGSAILVSGKCGTGKSFFAQQFVGEGAKCGEPALYVSFEEPYSDVERNFALMDVDLKKLESEGLLRVLCLNPLVSKAMLRQVSETVTEMSAKRLAVDSLTAFNMKFKDSMEQRMQTFEFITKLKRLGVTALLTDQILEHEYSSFGISEFLTDCVIRVSYENLGAQFARTLLIRKMRRSAHSQDIHPFKIDASGITIIEEL